MKTPTSAKRMVRRLAAVLAIATALAATGAWAEDWTVSGNTTLTADTTVDALTVESGVTLDLNGYKLYCSSVAGSGTITSPSADTDLTKPATEGGVCAMRSPSATYAGTVANLFSNNFTYRQDSVCRFMLKSANANQNLPLIIDYDFGEGNARVVNKYIVYVGTSGRAPKAWVLYGSNDPNASDDGWVAIDDARTNETGWTGAAKDKPADSRSYDCENTTAYRCYRLKITATNDSTISDKYLELVQLEYFDTNIAAGELHIDVASGQTANWAVTVSGNVKVVKEGAGTLAGAFQLDDVDFVIESGTVAASGNDMHIGSTAGKSASVTVNGGTLSVSGKQFKVGYYGTGTLTVNEGGMVEVASGYNTYIAEQSGSSGTINLNGGTLITRRVQNGSGTTPTLNFNGGTLKTNATVQQYGLINASAVVNVGEGGGTIDSGNLSDATSDSRVFVAADIGGTGAIRFKGGKTINIEGGVNCAGGAIVELGTKLNIPSSNTAAKDAILGNLVIDGRTTLTEESYDVLVASNLSAADLDKVTLINCTPGTGVGFDKDETPSKIVVKLDPATGVGTDISVLVFPDKTLQQIRFANFTARMLGKNVNPTYNALDSVSAYNKKLYYDNDSISSIVVEFKYSDSGSIKCVVIEFTDGDGGVHAKALGAKYKANTSLDTELYLKDRSWASGCQNKTVATTRTMTDYGVCDIHWTMGEDAMVWVLDANKDWSDFIGYDSLTSDDTVRIEATGDYTLTVDVDATVKSIEFIGAGSVTLAVESDKALTTDDIAGVGGITNNGTIVKTGEGTVTWPFDNAATGTTTVNAGTLKVAGKVNEGTAYNVRVKGGATFDLNGKSDVNVNVILEEGAVFTNTGSALGHNKDQIVSLTLEGDATVNVAADLGLIAQDGAQTTLALGSHTLTLAGSSTFRFTNTTITGDGTIALTGGCTVVIPNTIASSGADCTLTVGSRTTLNMGGNLSVKNFTNNGTIGSLTGGTLTVTGTLTPGSEIRRLTLASGATVKATGTAQVVSTTFSANGTGDKTITIDASAIDAETLKAAKETGIPVLTVPAAFVPSVVTWNVTGAAVGGTRAKWRTDAGGKTKTLYIARPTGLMISFQ